MKAQQRMLDNRIINDHRLVSKVFQVQYPHRARYMDRRGLVDMYDYPSDRSRWYPSGKLY